MELPRLRQSVLADRRVQDQPDVMRRARHRLAQRALDLAQLVHEIGLRVQAAGGVHQHHIGLARPRRRDAVVGDGCRIAARLLSDDLRADAPSPESQLLAGGRPEGVGRHQHDALALLAVQARQLAGCGGLADAVDASQQDHMERIQGRCCLPVGP